MWKALHSTQETKQRCGQTCSARGGGGSYTVHGILQAKILEWVAFPFSKGSSQPRNQTRVSCIAGGFFTSWVIREAPKVVKYVVNHYIFNICTSLYIHRDFCNQAAHTKGAILINLSDLGSSHGMEATKETACMWHTFLVKQVIWDEHEDSKWLLSEVSTHTGERILRELPLPINVSRDSLLGISVCITQIGKLPETDARELNIILFSEYVTSEGLSSLDVSTKQEIF